MASNNYIFFNENKTTIANTAASVTLSAGTIYTPNVLLTFTNAGNITITLPSASALVAQQQLYFGSANVGDIFRFNCINIGTTALIIAPGTGGTLQGPANGGATFSINVVILFTNVTLGTYAYDVYYGPGL